MFELRRLPTTPYEFDAPDTVTMLDVTIERDRNLSIVTRRGYTLPDILAAIGGIAVLLSYLISSLVALCTNNYIDRYMVTELFRVKKTDGEEDDEES